MLVILFFYDLSQHVSPPLQEIPPVGIIAISQVQLLNTEHGWVSLSPIERASFHQRVGQEEH